MLMSNIKVRDAHRNYEKHDAFYSIKPLNYILRFVGLSCIYREGSILKYSWSFPKHFAAGVLLAMLNCFNLYRKLVMSESRFSFNFLHFIKIIFMFGYLQYVVDLLHIYKYGGICCLAYYDIYDHIDKILRITDFKVIRKTIIIITAIFTTFGIISTVFDVAAWFLSCDSMFMGVNMIDYIYVLLRQFTVADHIAQVVQIEYRLKTLEHLLEEYYLSCENVPGVFKDVIAEKNKDAAVKGVASVDSVQIIGQMERTMMKLGRCYLLILEQADYINRMFGLRVMAVCLTILIDIIILLNVAIRISMGTIKITYYNGSLPVISSMFRMVSCALVLLAGMHRCERAYYQSERIIRLIYYFLNNKRMTTEMRETLTSLRDLMIARPVDFHAVNFYRLDNTLLLSVTSVVVTYTIIFLQNLK